MFYFLPNKHQKKIWKQPEHHETQLFHQSKAIFFIWGADLSADWGCTINGNLIKITIWPKTIFKSQESTKFVRGETCVSKYHYLNIVELQSRAGLHITFFRLKKTSVFNTYSCKNIKTTILTYFNKNENEVVKMIIPSIITNHFEIALSVENLLFFQNCAALVLNS